MTWWTRYDDVGSDDHVTNEESGKKSVTKSSTYEGMMVSH